MSGAAFLLRDERINTTHELVSIGATRLPSCNPIPNADIRIEKWV